MKFTSKVQLQNSTGRPMTFVLEPWGDVYRIPSGETAHVVGVSREVGCFHVELSDDGVLVWGWERSDAQVAIGGEHAGRDVKRESSAEDSDANFRPRRGVVHLLGRAMLAAGGRLLRLSSCP